MKKILFSLLAIAGLTTNTVNAQYVVFQDSFESYTDFAISNVGSWTLLDVDNSPSGGFNGITFPNGNGTNKAFQVFNSTTTTPVLTPTSTSNWTARTGQKTMTSFYLSSGASNNDWLISPKIQLAADGGALSFWAKSCDATYGAEKYRVYISTTGTAVADFTPLSAVQTTPSDVTWHEFTTSLSAYAGQQVYIAIQCSSTDQFGFAVDDFKVTTSIAPTTAPNCSTLTSPANGAIDVAFTSTTLSWAQSAGAESYDVYLDKNPNPTTLVQNVTGTSYTAASLDLSSTYYWKVVPKNTVGSATGCTVYSFTTAAATYCTAGATSTSWEKISNVTFADINNNSTATAGYEDFTSVVGNVLVGSTYTFTASFTGTSFDADQVMVWIDLNNDKDFDDAGEQVLVTPIGVSPWTGSITIPAEATIGATRMRVRLNDTSSSSSNTTPCGTATFGQVEDYTLNIGSLIAVNEVSKNGIKAYPNPVKDIFTIEAAGKIQSVKVFDVTGKQLLIKELNEVKSQIDLSKLNAGVYVVTTTMADGSTASTKVIKK